MHEIRPIARWARVNNETVEGVEQIGVVAFHKDGIKEVRYKINTGSMGPSDLSLVLSNFGSLTTEGDLNGDGKVDAGDLSLVLANFGKEYEIVVTESRINHKTKVEEYSFDFDFSKLEYGAIVEVQATIIANNDTILELKSPFSADLIINGTHSICLQNKAACLIEYNVDPNGDDSNDGIEKPFKTIKKAFSVANYGDIIVLSDGEHLVEDPKAKPQNGLSKWITVRGSGNTVVYSNGTFRTTGCIKFENLTVDIGRSGYSIGTYNIWWHNCKFYSPSTEAWWADGVAKHSYPDSSLKMNTKGNGNSFFRDGASVTDCWLDLYESGFGGCGIVRNSRITRIWGDAFAMGCGVFNANVDDFVGYLTDKHSDLYQAWNDRTNVIFYGVTATRLESVQAFLCRMKFEKSPPFDPAIHQQSALWNAAFVNCTIHHIPVSGRGFVNNGGPPFAQFSNKIHHVLFKNIKLPYQMIYVNGDEAIGWEHKDHKDVIFTDCDLHWKKFEEFTDPKKKWNAIEGGYEREGVKFLNCFNSVLKG